MRLTAGCVTFNSAAAAVKLPLRAAASKTNRALLEGSMRRSSGITPCYGRGENLAIAGFCQVWCHWHDSLKTGCSGEDLVRRTLRPRMLQNAVYKAGLWRAVRHAIRGHGRGRSLDKRAESVEIRSASKAYGAVRALDDVSLSVGAGEFVS